MIFKDRADAGERLAKILKNDPEIKHHLTQSGGIVISLLRGGTIVGNIIAKILKIGHLPLAVVKIPAPGNPELALGALCFDSLHLEKGVIDSLILDKATITNQVKIAREKFNSYLKRFAIKKSHFTKIKNKPIILVDDGVATGSTIKAAVLYLKSKKPRAIFLAVPVAPTDFDIKGIDKQFILHQEFSFGAVSQFYENFSQLEDAEVKNIIAS